MKDNSSVEIALRAFRRHVAEHSLAHYTGILSLQGLARLAVAREDGELLELCRRHLRPFVEGRVKFDANFGNYYCGGNGTALLLARGAFAEAKDAVAFFARDLMHAAPRDSGGIFCHPRFPGEGRIWIDVAFAVAPFLLYAGIALEEDAWIEEAFQQTRGMFEVFKDRENGLLHQSRGFAGPGRLSQDHWSRGNGWGMLAAAELVSGLPATDARRPHAEQMLRELTASCVEFQDMDGLWHQEITRRDSFVETSGTGLLLYGIGTGLAEGILPSSYTENLRRGLKGYLSYIGGDGSVRHTCVGCLCPGGGTIDDYMRQRHAPNDPHAFGPVILAFSAAERNGISCIEACDAQPAVLLSR